MNPDHPNRVRLACIEWVSLRLQRERPHEQPPPELAEQLMAIAEEHAMPIEAMIQWIERESRERPVTAAAARGWALAYDALTRETRQQHEE